MSRKDDDDVNKIVTLLFLVIYISVGSIIYLLNKII